MAKDKNKEKKELEVVETKTDEIVETKAEMPAKAPAEEIVDNSGAEVAIELEDPEFTPPPSDPKKRNSGRVLVILGIIVVLLAVAATIFYDVGGKEKIVSPLSIHGKSISSSDFSFMYHFELLSEGVDLFAASTETMLSSPYPDDDSFPTYRDYFRYLTAQDLQKMEILYDDATAKAHADYLAALDGLRALYDDPSASREAKVSAISNADSQRQELVFVVGGQVLKVLSKVIKV